MLTKHASRKRSQRLFPVIQPCEECGTTERVQRHHEDYEKPEEVRFLCQSCHTKRDMERGIWGNHLKKNYRATRFKTPRTCPICGRSFSNYTHSRVKTCSRACLSELGRRNAMKRWHPDSHDLPSDPLGRMDVPASPRTRRIA